MKVLKFGGTSVGSAQRMKDVAQLITDGEQKIVVLSAMSGTTNSLLEIADYLYKQNNDGALDKIAALQHKYESVIAELYTKAEYLRKGEEVLKERFGVLRDLAHSKKIFSLDRGKSRCCPGRVDIHCAGESVPAGAGCEEHVACGVGLHEDGPQWRAGHGFHQGAVVADVVGEFRI